VQLLTVVVAFAGAAFGFCSHEAIQKSPNRELSNLLMAFPLAITVTSWPISILNGLAALLGIVTPRNQELHDAVRHSERSQTLVAVFGIATGIGAAVSALYEKRPRKDGAL
jgi:hypothetical protein